MNRVVELPTADKPLSDGSVAGGWWHSSDEQGRIICDLCPRACQLKPGDRGFCFVRENRDGEMVLSTYGKSTGFCIDPIEKKPLNHFLPGTSVLSFGTAGCNLGCKFCQNWDISKSREVERLSDTASPATIAAAASQMGCRSVAYTYNDPVIWAEYAIDTARECRAVGIKNVAVTAGYICPAARGPFFEYLDAANIDLKAFSEEFYWEITYSHLQPVLETLQWLKQSTDVWFEITNLLIPDANDSPDEMRRMCEWLLAHVGDDVPIHFTAFHPDFRMKDRPPTPHETLLRGREIALECGIRFAYVGNVNDVKNQSTYCPSCQALLIERNWYELGRYNLTGNLCNQCGTSVPGLFEKQPGNWGNKRLPIRISDFAPAAEISPPLVTLQLAAPEEPSTATATTTSQPPTSQAESPDMSATISSAQPLTKEQETAVLDAACRILMATIWRRPVELPDETLAGAAMKNVMGVFVTAKRNGRLRGCCGNLGRAMPLIKALRGSAERTALEDQRFPPMSPTELPFLEIDVTMLSEFHKLSTARDERLAAVQIGLHGLHISRGQQSGLLLPVVATDYDWDAEQFLRHVCSKASLPVTAWEDQKAEVQTFEGHAIEGQFDTSAYDESLFRTAGPIPQTDLQQLADHCTANVRALASGATPSYYLPGAPDGTVLAAILAMTDPQGNVVAHYTQHSFRPGMPLQSTLFQLAQAVAQLVGAAAHQLDAQLIVMSDVAIHGSAAKPDAGGLRSNRVLAIIQGQRFTWQYDSNDDSTDQRMTKTIELSELSNPASATVFSLAATSTIPDITVRLIPEATPGRSRRPAAVAGSFYPADVGKLATMVNDMLNQAPTPKEAWPAAMVPHAGLQYSGRIAAQVLQHLEIPETIIVIGPKHTSLGVDCAVAPHEEWEIPGHIIASDVELATQLSEAIPYLELDAAAHEREHAIEVELPFLARLAPDSKVVGIALGGGDLQIYQALAAGLADFINKMDQQPLLLISSDMNHFASDDENRRLDEMAIQALETLDAEHIYRTVTENRISMCGLGPAIVVLETLRSLGQLARCERVAYATSADVSGDKSRVVGYAGMLFG